MIKVSGLYSDNMILQRNKNNRIYGVAGPGKEIEISLFESGLHKVMWSAKCTADINGSWECVIDPFEGGDTYSIVISGDDDKIIVSNVKFGDVFLLGGQSNMELTIGMIPDANEDVLRTAYAEDIRMFAVPHEYDFSGECRLLENIPWKGVNTETIAEFSAIGYFFAKEKYENDGVPVGLIHTAVGGAPIEALMSENNVLSQAEIIRNTHKVEGPCHHDKHRGCLFCYEDLLKKVKVKGYPENTVKDDLKRTAEWHEDIDSRDTGLRDRFMDEVWEEGSEYNVLISSKAANGCDSSVDSSDSCAETVKKTVSFNVPSFLDKSEYKNWFGTLWFQKEFYVSEKHAGKEAKLYLGTLVDFDTAYVNGVVVGHTDYRYPQRRYIIPSGVIRPGKNTVTVCLGMDGNVGGFLPDMPYKISMEVDICRGGCSSNCKTCGGDCTNTTGCRNMNTEVIDISLAGKWLLREGAETERLDGETYFLWHPSALYNSMLAPLRGLSIDSILFYQGESNGDRAEYYDILFEAMIKEWRELAGEDVPVYYSEVAVYLGDGPEYTEDSFAAVREVQRSIEGKVKDIHLIRITDLEAPYNELHPQNKKDVAHMFYTEYCS